MQAFENKEIIGRILKTTIGVIGRRTSDSYANVIIGSAIRELSNKYSFLKDINIQGTQYNEVYDIISFNSGLENVKPDQLANATNEFIEKISKSMGKDAGFYFIKEIKEDLPYEFEKTIKDIGIDLDYLQLQFITDLKDSYKFRIENFDILKNFFKILFDILDNEIGKRKAYLILEDLNKRFSIEYDFLKLVKINDVSSIPNIDSVTVDKNVNLVDENIVGTGIQKIVQELNNVVSEKNIIDFTDKIKDKLNSDYILKLNEIGVDFNVVKLKKELIIRHVIKALINVLTDSSNYSYATMVVNNVIREFDLKFSFFKDIKINKKSSENNDEEISISKSIENVNYSELGRGIQKIVEKITISLGDEAGSHFIEKFKKGLGKAYVLRIEEMGVNLHMIELKRNLTW